MFENWQKLVSAEKLFVLFLRISLIQVWYMFYTAQTLALSLPNQLLWIWHSLIKLSHGHTFVRMCVSNFLFTLGLLPRMKSLRGLVTDWKKFDLLSFKLTGFLVFFSYAWNDSTFSQLPTVHTLKEIKFPIALSEPVPNGSHHYQPPKTMWPYTLK